MLIAFDADVLSMILKPSIEPPIDPVTCQPTERTKERLEYLLAELEKAKARIIIPSPALSEFLVIAEESGPDYLSVIDRKAMFSIEPFDTRAAIEAAASTRDAIARGNKKSGTTGVWQAVKTDRQIVAIAKVLGVTRIYSNDRDMQNIASESGIEVIAVWQLPPPPAEQTTLFSDHEDSEQ